MTLSAYTLAILPTAPAVTLLDRRHYQIECALFASGYTLAKKHPSQPYRIVRIDRKRSIA